MSTLTQQTTAVTGNTITAAVWNDEWGNILDDYNGSITNANISATAAIVESKILFSTSGMVIQEEQMEKKYLQIEPLLGGYQEL